MNTAHATAATPYSRRNHAASPISEPAARKVRGRAAAAAPNERPGALSIARCATSRPTSHGDATNRLEAARMAPPLRVVVPDVQHQRCNVVREREHHQRGADGDTPAAPEPGDCHARQRAVERQNREEVPRLLELRS